jgi:hypothetical protein
MPRRKKPRECACGCKQLTAGGKYLPGHDSKTLGAIVEAAGGVSELRTLVERTLERTIHVNLD